MGSATTGGICYYWWDLLVGSATTVRSGVGWSIPAYLSFHVPSHAAEALEAGRTRFCIESVVLPLIETGQGEGHLAGDTVSLAKWRGEMCGGGGKGCGDE